ncbi:NADP-dependent malic enzyme [Candidatus Woesearchaeota archaeon]|nr:NADP-dependent malic enzyme [Candidatus Woesearchaeota archaeon]
MAHANSSGALELHSRLKGKISIAVKFPVKDRQDLALIYTPGVAEPSREIARDKKLVYKYTMKPNTVAVVSDGSAVLGLGNIGAEAALPVMEGKCVLFKQLAGIDAFPICIRSQEPDGIIETVKNISPVFGGINLEDIAAPKCFYIEDRLKRELDIPVIHDDQHGSAVVVLAGLINALKATGRDKEDAKIVMNGAGAAGTATAKLLVKYGFRHIKMADRNGAIYPGRKEGINEFKEEMARITNPEGKKGDLNELLEGADVFIGLSGPGILHAENVRRMRNPIVFALANPVPEIMPDEARKGGAVITATGRSDYPNQVNNSLAFPGLFRGTLDAKAKIINDEMKIAAAEALAGLVKPTKERILIENLDRRIVPAIAKAVREAAIRTGAA